MSIIMRPVTADRNVTGLDKKPLLVPNTSTALAQSTINRFGGRQRRESVVGKVTQESRDRDLCCLWVIGAVMSQGQTLNSSCGRDDADEDGGWTVYRQRGRSAQRPWQRPGRRRSARA